MFSDFCSLISLFFEFILLAKSIAVPEGASFFENGVSQLYFYLQIHQIK